MSDDDAPSARDLQWDEFMRVDMRVGRIVEVEDFPEARRPAWKLRVDFGEELGMRRSSAQIRNSPATSCWVAWSSPS
jgi:tRNA-binding protein